jgi:hypothetical protein
LDRKYLEVFILEFAMIRRTKRKPLLHLDSLERELWKLRFNNSIILFVDGLAELVFWEGF